MAAWGPSTGPSMNWCSSSRWGPALTPTASAWETPGATARMCGTMQASAASAPVVPMNLPCSPTVKPVALVADAIRDCSRRGERVLDIFGGSGSTLIAAETCGRHARLIEFDPCYCDTILMRWQAYTGKRAILADANQDFEMVAEIRSVARDLPSTE
ncbi:DNA methyltransferase [Mesorhizobium sp. VK22B]|uniref:site-specific DNA-methyltransferase (adenine-specific) n=1 Tax=Mesorhizobium captivum TaxID=3072319 RepID=A0ABU4YYR5_9HYPH|nr:MULTISPECIES: DNA methyltransferase [unclassified Mesorhizobium]MDX8492104.1 DNA methyltransferase [Mesorhizobium sp. VK22B]MDX8506383.1 DNA methyltransferase [Mesorhizobium sp. VK22E]